MGRQTLILIADDYEDSAELLAELLRLECGYETIAAKDGAQALSLALAREPLAALLDFDMPGSSGLEVAFKLREQRRGSILLAAMSGGSDLASLASVGVFDLVFRKPLSGADRAEFRRKIDERMRG